MCVTPAKPTATTATELAFKHYEFGTMNLAGLLIRSHSAASTNQMLFIPFINILCITLPHTTIIRFFAFKTICSTPTDPLRTVVCCYSTFHLSRITVYPRQNLHVSVDLEPSFRLCFSASRVGVIFFATLGV